MGITVIYCNRQPQSPQAPDEGRAYRGSPGSQGQGRRQLAGGAGEVLHREAVSFNRPLSAVQPPLGPLARPPPPLGPRQTARDRSRGRRTSRCRTPRPSAHCLSIELLAGRALPKPCMTASPRPNHAARPGKQISHALTATKQSGQVPFASKCRVPGLCRTDQMASKVIVARDAGILSSAASPLKILFADGLDARASPKGSALSPSESVMRQLPLAVGPTLVGIPEDLAVPAGVMCKS
jgi:hypothetical protein